MGKLHPTVSALLNAAAASQPTFPPLTIEMLNTLPPQAQKQTLGEQIFPLVSRLQPALAGKITGMVLELDNREISNCFSQTPCYDRKLMKLSKCCISIDEG